MVKCAMAACVQATVPPSGAGPGSHRDEVAERRDRVLDSERPLGLCSCVTSAPTLSPRSCLDIARSSSSSSGIGHGARLSGSSIEGERLQFVFCSSPTRGGVGAMLGDQLQRWKDGRASR
jgi:hypothetical protein